jgi:hypothetical protein
MFAIIMRRPLGSVRLPLSSQTYSSAGMKLVTITRSRLAKSPSAKLSLLMAKDTPTDATTTSRRKAALHDAIADWWEGYLRRAQRRGITSANALRLRRRIKLHRALAAKFRG